GQRRVHRHRRLELGERLTAILHETLLHEAWPPSHMACQSKCAERRADRRMKRRRPRRRQALLTGKRSTMLVNSRETVANQDKPGASRRYGFAAPGSFPPRQKGSDSSIEVDAHVQRPGGAQDVDVRAVVVALEMEGHARAADAQVEDV